MILFEPGGSSIIFQINDTRHVCKRFKYSSMYYDHNVTEHNISEKRK